MNVPPFNTYLGVRVERMEGGEAVALLELGPHHLNNRGVVHGGVLSALLDTALGAAVISSIPKEWWCATTSLSVQFLEGARAGLLTASGRVLRRGRRVAFAGGEVHDAGGRLVAVAQGSWYLWPGQPETAERASEAHVIVRGTGETIRVGKILAVGRNYAEHAAEMEKMGPRAGAAGRRSPRGGEPEAPVPADDEGRAGPRSKSSLPAQPDEAANLGSVLEPVLFLKPPSSIVHDAGTVRVPLGLGEIHHEVELVVVIGKEGRTIPQAEAMDHVLGYAVGLDMTLRELQTQAKRRGDPWTLSKGFDGSAPVSLVAPRDEVGDPSGLAITLAVNGKRRQTASTSGMIHPIAALVSRASALMTLERGDLLFTGTPSGVGPVLPGDTIEAQIEKVGRLTVQIAAQGG